MYNPISAAFNKILFYFLIYEIDFSKIIFSVKFKKKMKIERFCEV